MGQCPVAAWSLPEASVRAEKTARHPYPNPLKLWHTLHVAVCPGLTVAGTEQEDSLFELVRDQLVSEESSFPVSAITS